LQSDESQTFGFHGITAIASLGRGDLEGLGCQGKGGDFDARVPRRANGPAGVGKWATFEGLIAHCVAKTHGFSSVAGSGSSSKPSFTGVKLEIHDKVVL